MYNPYIDLCLAKLNVGLTQQSGEHFRRDLRILSALSILVWQNAVNDSELGGYVEDSAWSQEKYYVSQAMP